MADNETIADIIAEMRGQAGDDGYPLDIKHYADRLEAALKRELSKNTSKNGADFGQLGDAAKLRAALAFCADVLDDWGGGIGDMERAARMARAALTEPARNCDRPECVTTKAAQDVWRKEDGGKMAYYEWLLANYEKGENNGNE